jgi:predicted acyl esterase
MRPPEILPAMIVEQRVSVPMRDGVVLRADVYRPAQDGAVPALVLRTPYDRSVPLIPPSGTDVDAAIAVGYAVVCQDVRGMFGSDGDFYTFVHEASDGFDTVEWVAAQPWCNGAVGMIGRSYARCLGAPAASARDLPGRHGQRLLPRLGLPGRRVPARLQPVLGLDDEQHRARRA